MVIYCKAFVFVQKTEFMRQWFVCGPLETYRTELGKYSNLCSNNISDFKIILFSSQQYFFFVSNIHIATKFHHWWGSLTLLVTEQANSVILPTQTVHFRVSERAPHVSDIKNYLQPIREK